MAPQLPLNGSIIGMAKEKVTISVDRAKLSEATAMLGVSSTSAAIDIALSQLVRRHRALRDAKAYVETPPTAEEAALGAASLDWRDLADETDWDALWPEDA